MTEKKLTKQDLQNYDDIYDSLRYLQEKIRKVANDESVDRITRTLHEGYRNEICIALNKLRDIFSDDE